MDDLRTAARERLRPRYTPRERLAAGVAGLMMLGLSAVGICYAIRRPGLDPITIWPFAFWGLGAHHSISQYMAPVFPVDLAAGIFYQKIQLGDDFIDASAFQVSAQASKRYPVGFAIVEPYAGLSVDMFSMDVTYEKDDLDIDLAFETDTTLDLTLGVNLIAAFFSLNGEYSIASQNSFAFGFGLGF